MTISDEKVESTIDSFAISYKASYRSGGINYKASMRLEGSNNMIRFTIWIVRRFINDQLMMDGLVLEHVSGDRMMIKGLRVDSR